MTIFRFRSQMSSPLLREITMYFVGNNDNRLKFTSVNSTYAKLVSDTPLDYNTFAARCSSKLHTNW